MQGDFSNMSEEIKVKLLKPLIDVTAEEKGTEEINELIFKEPTIGDFINYKLTDFGEIKKIVEVTAKLTGHRIELIKQLSPKDFRKCSDIIQGFFLDSQEIQDL